MKAKPLPDLQYLKECFVIDSSIPEGLRWSPSIPKFANKKAGRLCNNTYYHTQLDKRNYFNHRIIYALFHGTTDFTDCIIDHIDNNKRNNNPNNLRLATFSQNNYNSSIYKNNKSGHKNITIKNGKYVVEFRINKTYCYVGLYNTLEEAIAIRDQKAKEIAGNFMRL